MKKKKKEEIISKFYVRMEYCFDKAMDDFV
jgi:hypothetical protein